MLLPAAGRDGGALRRRDVAARALCSACYCRLPSPACSRPSGTAPASRACRSARAAPIFSDPVHAHPGVYFGAQKRWPPLFGSLRTFRSWDHVEKRIAHLVAPVAIATVGFAPAVDRGGLRVTGPGCASGGSRRGGSLLAGDLRSLLRHLPQRTAADRRPDARRPRHRRHPRQRGGSSRRSSTSCGAADAATRGGRGPTRRPLTRSPPPSKRRSTGRRPRNPNPGRVASRRPEPRRVRQRHLRPAGPFEVDGAALLPSDMAGFGFDNNADVLSITPALMSRYIAAATKISRARDRQPRQPNRSCSCTRSATTARDARAGEDVPFATHGGLAVRHKLSPRRRLHLRHSPEAQRDNRDDRRDRRGRAPDRGARGSRPRQAVRHRRQVPGPDPGQLIAVPEDDVEGQRLHEYRMTARPRAGNHRPDRRRNAPRVGCLHRLRSVPERVDRHAGDRHGVHLGAVRRQRNPSPPRCETGSSSAGRTARPQLPRRRAPARSSGRWPAAPTAVRSPRPTSIR